jgi:hypothetical protein
LKPQFAFKLIVMVLMLTGVLYSIRSMNEKSVEKAFDALGLQEGGAGSPGLQAAGAALKPGEERFNLCRTRINGIEFGTGRKINEATAGLKTTWLASEPVLGQKQDPAPSGAPREIGTLDIEKWLTQHCQIVVRAVPHAAVESLNSRSKIDVRYVDGTTLSLLRIGGRYFEIGQRDFESEDFAAALVELQLLAQFNPASGL